MINWQAINAPWWADAPTIIVGAGSSLTDFNFDRLRGLGYVLAVKEAVWDLPFADACFGLDLPWMNRQHAALATLPMPLYLAVPIDNPEAIITPLPNAIYLQRRRRCDGLSFDPIEIEAGGNSGYGAFNLAVQKKAKSIYLFGFDYGGSHYCQARYTHSPEGHNARYWPRWGENFKTVLPDMQRLGIEVVNASPQSTVSAFQKMSIDQAIAALQTRRNSHGHQVSGQYHSATPSRSASASRCDGGSE